MPLQQKPEVLVDDRALEQMRMDALTGEERELILRSGLPGAADLFNPDPAKATEAKRKVAIILLGPATAHE